RIAEQIVDGDRRATDHRDDADRHDDAARVGARARALACVEAEARAHVLETVRCGAVIVGLRAERDVAPHACRHQTEPCGTEPDSRPPACHITRCAPASTGNAASSPVMRSPSRRTSTPGARRPETATNEILSRSDAASDKASCRALRPLSDSRGLVGIFATLL